MSKLAIHYALGFTPSCTKSEARTFGTFSSIQAAQNTLADMMQYEQGFTSMPLELLWNDLEDEQTPLKQDIIGVPMGYKHRVWEVSIPKTGIKANKYKSASEKLCLSASNDIQCMMGTHRWWIVESYPKYKMHELEEKLYSFTGGCLSAMCARYFEPLGSETINLSALLNSQADDISSVSANTRSKKKIIKSKLNY